MTNTKHDRRQFLALATACAASFSTRCLAQPSLSNPIAKAAVWVKSGERWTADHLYDFLNALPNSSLLALKKALELVDETAGLDALKGRSKDVREIQKQALWISSNVLAYPFRDETVLNYHSLVAWVATDAGVAPDLIAAKSTFAIEREIQMQLFAQLWDKLTVKQREQLLEKIDPHGSIKNKAAITALGGAGALAALSVTVAFTGFAFYTTMAVTISTVAGFFGLTLPFAAYTGASTLVAFLSGPVGWAIMGVAAVGGVAYAGRANAKKTAAFICQIHALKVAALIEAGVPEKDIFGKSNKPSNR